MDRRFWIAMMLVGAGLAEMAVYGAPDWAWGMTVVIVAFVDYMNPVEGRDD